MLWFATHMTERLGCKGPRTRTQETFLHCIFLLTPIARKSREKLYLNLSKDNINIELTIP
jgi:hypothetical protein